MTDDVDPQRQRALAVHRAIGRCGLPIRQNLLLRVLYTNANMHSNICAINTKKMAKETGFGRSTVFLALKELKAAGFLLPVKQEHLKSTHYLINTHLILRLAAEPKSGQ